MNLQDICIGLSFWGNMTEIVRMRNSLPFNIPMIAVNGPYSDFDGINPNFGNDGARAFLESYPNTTIIDCPPLKQPEKRQLYLDKAGELGYKYLIIMDSAEYVFPGQDDWGLLLDNLRVISEQNPQDQLFFMEMYMPKGWDRAHNNIELGRFQKWGRIVKDPGTLKYAFWCHYRLIRKEFTEMDVIKNKTDVIKAHYIIEGVKLSTDSLLRSEEFLDMLIVTGKQIGRASCRERV